MIGNNVFYTDFMTSSYNKLMSDKIQKEKQENPGSFLDEVEEKWECATKEDYHDEGWFKGYQNGRGQTLFNQKTEDSFWERRIKHKKRMKEQLKRWQEKKWLEDKRLQKMYEQEMMYRGIEERYRIAGKDYRSPERRLPVISTAYQTSMLMDLLLSHSV